MALTHTTAIRNGLADYTVDAIDLGTTNPTGALIFMAAADAEVATLVWSATPGFGAAANGTATMNAINDDTSATGGEVVAFQFANRDRTEIFRGTVSGSGGGGDIELSSTTIGAGATVSMTSFTYTASL